ncbi:MAG: hypothetical protein Fur0020_11160 [Thermodesulfovibrionia bacterium]
MAKRIVILLLVLFLSSCATTMPEKKGLESSLRNSAEKYWQIRLNGNLEELYEMEYREDLPPLDKYKVEAGLIRKNIITKYSVKDIIVEGNRGTVYIEFLITIPPVPQPFKQTLIDRWIWDKGWRHILNPRKVKEG